MYVVVSDENNPSASQHQHQKLVNTNMPLSTFNSTAVQINHLRIEDVNQLEFDGATKPTKHLECIRDTESYAFLIGWSIVNYSIVLVFAILLLTWYDINQKSTQIRIRILEIIR